MIAKTITPQMKDFREGLIDFLRGQAGNLDASEMLAIAAYTVGQMVAMQDARKWTPEAAMELVSNNIELGNAHAIDEASKWMASS